MAAFSKDQQFLYAGTVLGDVKVWVYSLQNNLIVGMGSHESFTIIVLDDREGSFCATFMVNNIQCQCDGV